MEIIDEEPKKKLPQLQPGDVIRAKYHEKLHYFMIIKLLDEHIATYSTVNLCNGLLSSNGEFTQTTDEGFYLNIDYMIEDFKKHGFTHIEKVELEARVKHEEI